MVVGGKNRDRNNGRIMCNETVGFLLQAYRCIVTVNRPRIDVEKNREKRWKVQADEEEEALMRGA